MSVKNWKLNRMSCRSRVACDIHMSWVLDEFLSFQSNEDVFDYLTSFCAKKITSKKPVNFLGFGLSRYRYYSYYKILYMYTVYTYLYTYVYIVYMILCTCGCGYRCTANVTDTQCFPQTRSLGICCSLVPETASARSDLTAARMDDEPWERAFVWHFWQAWSFWNHISSF